MTHDRTHFRRIPALLLLFALLLPAAVPALAAGPEGPGALSQAGADFLKARESFSETPYTDGTNWYVGYGTQCQAGAYAEGITEEEADRLLREAAAVCAAAVADFLEEHGRTVGQSQFDALVSFTYSLGTGWLSGSSDLAELLAGPGDTYDTLETVNAFGVWCHAGGQVVKGLARRRMEEAALFLWGDYSGQAAGNFTYLVFDPGEGEMASDVMFYQAGQPYGAFPDARREGYALEGWRRPEGGALLAGMPAGESGTVEALWRKLGPAESPYPDLDAGAWYYDYVCALSGQGIVSGYPDGTFDPSGSVTLGEALKLVLLAAGYEEQAPAGGHWSSGYAALARTEGLLTAGELAELDGAVSRLTVARLTAGALGLAPASGPSPFADADDASVTALYEWGILEGSEENGRRLYKPADGIRRAELSALIWRVNCLRAEETGKAQITYGAYTVDVLEGVPVNGYDPAAFRREGSVMEYAAGETRLGVDVSSYQGDIDWARVKADGVDFAILRVGGRGYTEGGLYADTKFEQNLQGALDAGLEVGVYFFSQAITVKEAEEEARFVLDKIRGYALTGPVVFDWEALGKSEARTYGLDTDTLCRCALAFCELVEEAGYTPMIYLTSYAGYVKYDLSRVMDYPFWFAEYDKAAPTFYYHFQMWQYTSKGSVDGIQGNVDMNLWFGA